jgi:hypothetical protein
MKGRATWGKDHHKAARFAGEIAPAVAGTLRNSYTSTGRYVGGFILNGNTIEAGNDDEMLFFVEVEMHARGAAWVRQDSTIA